MLLRSDDAIEDGVINVSAADDHCGIPKTVVFVTCPRRVADGTGTLDPLPGQFVQLANGIADMWFGN